MYGFGRQLRAVLSQNARVMVHLQDLQNSYVRRRDQNSTFSRHGPFTRMFGCRILRISAKDRGRLVLPGQAATVSCPIIPIYRPGAREPIILYGMISSWIPPLFNIMF